MFPSFLIAASLFLPVQEEEIFSGPQAGEQLVPFSVMGTIGKDADKEIDLLKEAGDLPLVIVFVHEKTRPAFGLSNAVMRLVADRPGKVLGGLVYLSEDQTGAATWMNNIKKHFPAGIRVGISPDGQEGPGAYGLNRKVSVTVLVAQKKTVTANFALVQPSLQADAPQIFKAIASVLGEKKVPSVAKYANPGAVNPRMRKKPGAGTTRPVQDPMLRPLLVPFIQKDATEEEVVAAAKKIEDYAAKNPKSKVQIGDIARRIIAADRLSNYGTKKCQEYLTKWASDFTAPKPVRQPATRADSTED